MSLKTKIDETLQNLNESLPVVAANIGLVAMTAAATLGTMPDSGEKRLVLPTQANYIKAVFQRTPARAGKH
jgi:hypothetical protein